MAAPGSVLASGGSYLSDQVLCKLSIKGSIPSPSFRTVNLPLEKLAGKHSFLKHIFLNFQNLKKKRLGL